MAETTTQSRYFELLGRAYEIPLESAGFEDFLDAAHDFFCADPETGKVAEDVAKFTPEGVEDHTSRLERIFDVAMRAEARPKNAIASRARTVAAPAESSS